MNYTQLTAAVKSYTENLEATFVETIPTFIKQAEERIIRNPQVRIIELHKNATLTLSAGDRFLSRPADFIAMSSVAVISAAGKYSFVYDKDTNFIREAYPDPAVTGVPKYYTQFEGDVVSPASTGKFMFGPTPSANYSVELHYYYDPVSIVDAGSSWFGDNAEMALLYGTLIEAYTFMKGDADIMAGYEKKYAEGMAGLGVVGLRTHRDNYKDGELSV